MRKQKSELYFEEIGSNFDNWMSLYDVNQRIDLIKSLMPLNTLEMSCLEIGCGTGKISEAIQPLVKDFTVSDLSEKLAKETGNRLGTHWVVQDACHLKIPDHSFDMVISSECIEHVPNPKLALSEMARILKPQGFLIVTSPNKLWYPVLWLSMILKIRNFEGNENWMFPKEAVNTLIQNNMTNIQISGCHLFPWQIPLAKSILPIFDQYGEKA